MNVLGDLQFELNYFLHYLWVILPLREVILREKVGNSSIFVGRFRGKRGDWTECKCMVVAIVAVVIFLITGLDICLPALDLVARQKCIWFGCQGKARGTN